MPTFLDLTMNLGGTDPVPTLACVACLGYRISLSLVKDTFFLKISAYHFETCFAFAAISPFKSAP
jgi:hypothetical protein